MKEFGAQFELKTSPHVSQDPEVRQVQQDITRLRAEYAENDWQTNYHEYLGVVEDLNIMLGELQQKIDSTKQQYPEATFVLEYHKSCALPSDATFLIYSFGLQAKIKEAGAERRLNTFIGWKIDVKPEYPDENAAVDAFMDRNGIQPYIDDFVSRSPRRCRIDNEDK